MSTFCLNSKKTNFQNNELKKILLLRLEGSVNLLKLLGLENTHDERENANNRNGAAEEESSGNILIFLISDFDVET